jgi:adenylate cyclase
MTRKSGIFIRESALSASAFIVGNYLFYWYSYGAIQEYFRPGPLKDYLDSSAIHAELWLTGIGLGVMLVGLDRISDRPRIRRRSVLQVVALKAFLFLGAIIGIEVTLLAALPLLGISRAWVMAGLREMTPAYTLGVWLQLFFLGALINLALQARRLIGPGIFWDLLRGRYQHPRTEEQVFLFMDLKSSTTLAESMGHERYSGFLQSCIRDLTDVAIRNNARVYQYVGDEVVLNWPTKEGAARACAVRSYFEFAQALEDRGPEYEQRYGSRPVFRGGAGVGEVTVAEIGEIKRSIAFHGDPLNTAARILELCKQNNGEVFVSDDVFRGVPADEGYELTWQGEVLLRGKGERVKVLGLSRGDRAPLPAREPSS